MTANFSRRLGVVCLTILLGAFFHPLAQASQVTKSAAPAWVDEADIRGLDATFSDEHQNGVAWILDDTQWNWDGQIQTMYVRYVLEVLNREGLEYAATLDIEFNPEVDDLALHRARILRNGTEIDILDTLAPEVLRREEDLEEGIIDGWLTAHDDIEGVQIGDRIEIAYTLTEARPLFKTALGFSNDLKFSIPVGLKRIKLRVPAGTEFQQATHGIDLAPTVETKDGSDNYVWQLDRSDAVPGEEDRPREFPLWGYLEVSGWEDWNAVRDEVADYYQPEAGLPDRYQSEIANILKTAASPAERMSKTLQFVQNDIRYMSNAVGYGGFVPRQPGLVVERGFGDCKDKSLLLTAVLRVMGIKASVALANTSTGYGLPDRLASPYRFNHAIVRAEIGKDVFWLDPTWTQSGGSGNSIVQPDYGYALVLDKDLDGLQPIDPKRPTRAASAVTESYWLPDKPEDPVRFQITSIFRDSEADYMRRQFSRVGKREMSRRYATYYEKRYPGLERADRLKVVDNKETNEFTVFENYRLSIDDFSQPETSADFVMRASSLYSSLPTPSGFDRRSPIRLETPKTYEHTIKVTDPLLGFRPEEDIAIENEVFSYHRTSPVTDTSIEYKWRLDIKQRSVPRNLVKAYLRTAKESRQENYVSYDFSNYLKALNGDAKTKEPERFTQQVVCSGLWKYLPYCNP